MLIIISQIVPDAESHQFWCSFPSLPWHIHRYHAFMQKFFFSSHITCPTVCPQHLTLTSLPVLSWICRLPVSPSFYFFCSLTIMPSEFVTTCRVHLNNVTSSSTSNAFSCPFFAVRVSALCTHGWPCYVQSNICSSWQSSWFFGHADPHNYILWLRKIWQSPQGKLPGVQK